MLIFTGGEGGGTPRQSPVSTPLVDGSCYFPRLLAGRSAFLCQQNVVGWVFLCSTPHDQL